MNGILTRSSEREILHDYGTEFLQDLRLTIKAWCEKKECKSEVIHALIHGECVCDTLASNDNEIATFEVETFVGDTIVLSFVGLAS